MYVETHAQTSGALLVSFVVTPSTPKTDSMHEINIELISIAVAVAVVLK